MMRKKGFTLIEVLVTLMLMGVISLTITSVYVVGMKTYQGELATSTVQSDGQTVLDSLVNDIRNGVSIEATHGSYSTNSQNIIIVLPAIDSSKNIIYSGTDMVFDRIIYTYQDNSIHKIILSENSSSIRHSKNGIDTVLDKNVLTLGFEYDPDQESATLVKVTISSNVKAGNETRHIELTGQARLRNHI